MVLEMKGIVKRYGTLTANNHVSLQLHEGEILAIVGENGAGKSTIMKILYGLEHPDAGEIWVHGIHQHFHSPADAMNQGIGMVQQHFMLFDTMTATENILFMNEITKGIFLDQKKAQETVRQLSEKYKLQIDPNVLIKDCPVGLRQRIEILKVLYQNAEIIIFDEPSAVLTPIEVDELLVTIRNLAAMGKSIIFITHKLNEVMAVADRVVVMRSGEVVAETLIKDTTVDQLSYAMVGRQIKQLKVVPREAGNCLLQVEDLCLEGEGRLLLDQVSIHVNEREIVGIAGVSGNGQSELIQCITGLRTYQSGTVRIQGKDVTRQSVRQIRESGLSHIPEDRYLWGSAKEATLEENALMGYERKPQFGRFGILRGQMIRRHCDGLIQKFAVKASGGKQRIAELSGGNAQKLIVAREMELNEPFLIACEPTRGIDIGAAEFIHERLIEKKERGGGVLLVSSELSEIVSLCDRIYVMFEGRISGMIHSGTFDDRELSLLMVGGKGHD